MNKAGLVLRRWAHGELTDPSAPRAALDVLLAFRAAHEVPLTKANMGLRSVVRTERCRVEVSQRLKRVPTIIDKLTREPTMQLANMQDIGGCRSVLDSIDEVRPVQERLAKTALRCVSPTTSTRLRMSGYRGVHIIVAYDDRPIEVQLRDPRDARVRAITVERLSGRLAEDLKSGVAPNPCSTGWKPSPKQWRWRNRVHGGPCSRQPPLTTPSAGCTLHPRRPAMTERIQHFLLVFDHEQEDVIENPGVRRGL